MPSVMTIEGAGSRGRERLDDGEKCKWVRNPKTGCETQLCFVGKSRSRSGWKFMKGTSRCRTR